MTIDTDGLQAPSEYTLVLESFNDADSDRVYSTLKTDTITVIVEAFKP